MIGNTYIETDIAIGVTVSPWQMLKVRELTKHGILGVYDLKKTKGYTQAAPIFFFSQLLCLLMMLYSWNMKKPVSIV